MLYDIIENNYSPFLIQLEDQIINTNQRTGIRQKDKLLWAMRNWMEEISTTRCFGNHDQTSILKGRTTAWEKGPARGVDDNDMNATSFSKSP